MTDWEFLTWIAITGLGVASLLLGMSVLTTRRLRKQVEQLEQSLRQSDSTDCPDNPTT